MTRERIVDRYCEDGYCERYERRSVYREGRRGSYRGDDRRRYRGDDRRWQRGDDDDD